MDYIKTEHDKTRTLPGHWYLSSYRYKFNHTHFKPFLEALKNKKLLGLRCQQCNTVSFPPKIVCGKCLVKPERWVHLRETATIATYTVAYEKNEETGEIYGKPVVAIRQDGSDTTWNSELNPNIDSDDCYIGMPLKVHWKEETTGSLEDIEYYDLVEDHAKKLPLRKD
jgi:uncharacterized OB-fold protein